MTMAIRVNLHIADRGYIRCFNINPDITFKGLHDHVASLLDGEDFHLQFFDQQLIHGRQPLVILATDDELDVFVKLAGQCHNLLQLMAVTKLKDAPAASRHGKMDGQKSTAYCPSLDRMNFLKPYYNYNPTAAYPYHITAPHYYGMTGMHQQQQQLAPTAAATTTTAGYSQSGQLQLQQQQQHNPMPYTVFSGQYRRPNEPDIAAQFPVNQQISKANSSLPGLGSGVSGPGVLSPVGSGSGGNLVSKQTCLGSGCTDGALCVQLKPDSVVRSAASPDSASGGAIVQNCVAPTVVADSGDKKRDTDIAETPEKIESLAEKTMNLRILEDTMLKTQTMLDSMRDAYDKIKAQTAVELTKNATKDVVFLAV